MPQQQATGSFAEDLARVRARQGKTPADTYQPRQDPRILRLIGGINTDIDKAMKEPMGPPGSLPAQVGLTNADRERVFNDFSTSADVAGTLIGTGAALKGGMNLIRSARAVKPPSAPVWQSEAGITVPGQQAFPVKDDLKTLGAVWDKTAGVWRLPENMAAKGRALVDAAGNPVGPVKSMIGADVGSAAGQTAFGFPGRVAGRALGRKYGAPAGAALTAAALMKLLGGG